MRYQLAQANPMPSSHRAVPHPFPYQGSKRSICRHILPHIPAGSNRLVEPFCGSAAVSLAAAAQGSANCFWLNDANAPRHLHIHAGRSSQSTLLGRDCETVESLYLSPALIERLDQGCGERTPHV